MICTGKCFMDLMNKTRTHLHMYPRIHKHARDLIWCIGGIMSYTEYIFMIKSNIIEAILSS